MNRLTNKNILITGGNSGIGLAAAQEFDREGARVAICGTRIPPVHVAAMATLNRLAPGRVHLGVGTGNTATRSMGQPPMRIAEYAEHLRVLREVDLVRARRDGRRVLYRTNAGAIRPLYEWAGTFERYWRNQLTRIKERAERGSAR